jgi:tetratricopeptide (TPR) repeat protein
MWATYLLGPMLASSWSNAGVIKCELLAERGRFQEIREIADEMINLGRQSAFKPALRWGTMAKAKAFRRLGRLHECEPLLKETTDLSIRELDFMNLGVAQSELAFCQIELGHYDEARRNLEEYRRFVNERRIIAFTVIYHHFGLAALGILDAEGSRDAKRKNRMLRACQEAHKISQIYRNGLPISMRLMGTAQWLLGRSKKADHWWDQSQKAAERLAAPYQVGLTVAERGRRTGSKKDIELGRSILASLGIEARSVEQAPLV